MSTTVKVTMRRDWLRCPLCGCGWRMVTRSRPGLGLRRLHDICGDWAEQDNPCPGVLVPADRITMVPLTMIGGARYRPRGRIFLTDPEGHHTGTSIRANGWFLLVDGKVVECTGNPDCLCGCDKD